MIKAYSKHSIVLMRAIQIVDTETYDLRISRCRLYVGLFSPWLVAVLVATVNFKLDTILKIIDKLQQISIRYSPQSKPITHKFAQSLFVLTFLSRSGILYRIFLGEPVCVRMSYITAGIFSDV